MIRKLVQASPVLVHERSQIKKMNQSISLKDVVSRKENSRIACTINVTMSKTEEYVVVLLE